MKSLDLGIVGNGMVSALIDEGGEIVWSCFPRFDGDPMFCSLLRRDADNNDSGHFAIDLVNCTRVEREYAANTAVLLTRLYDDEGSVIEIADFAPRFTQHGRMYAPMALVRQLRRIAGSPRVRVRVRPACNYGGFPVELTRGSNHIRFVGGPVVVRLTTDVPITAILEESVFFLHDALHLFLGPDETLHGTVADVCREYREQTVAYWRDWVRRLAIPFEWQEPVIRAAITLKLNAFEDTGAVVAAMTTSIPEAPDTPRTWDYRYCWLRDGYFVIDALNRLGATHTMEQYLGYILNVIAAAGDEPLQPVYGISGSRDLSERTIDSLAGYRGMGPVRVGNAAYLQVQHDVYGSAILASTHLFFDRRLVRDDDELLFHRLEALGERAARLFDQPDAGIWEIRGPGQIHTFSSVICWAGCDRLARIARRLGRPEREEYWRDQAAHMHETICRRAWNEKLGAFVGTMEGDALDASLLLLNEVGFLPATDPRFIGTVDAIGRDLRHGDFIYRYIERDDFGVPETAFLVCTFWYIDALAALGRTDEARALFEVVLSCRNALGLLSEDIHPTTHELWGNFVQTYSMVGLIGSAIRLSLPWDQAF